jgi:hypothetical protein
VYAQTHHTETLPKKRATNDNLTPNPNPTRTLTKSATGLSRACAGFLGAVKGWPAVAAFLGGFGVGRRERDTCYNMSNQLPSGHDATISSGDWSGVGTGTDGSSWDFETCTFLVEAIGTNGVTDMFFPRAWSMEWLTAHCKRRFNVTPQPRALPDLWGFDEEMLPRVTSRIIFTNGLNDGWSVGGFMRNLSESLLVFNMPNGAHHSDLSHNWPSDADTQDVRDTREAIAAQLEEWIA